MPDIEFIYIETEVLGGGSSESPGYSAGSNTNLDDTTAVTDTDIPLSDTNDLGTTYLNYSTYLLLQESRRLSGDFNGFIPPNHRYRGHREANKFNLSIQKLIAVCTKLFIDLNTANETLKTSEANDVYLTEAEIQNIYHISEQLRFKEWLLLKDVDSNWFI